MREKVKEYLANPNKKLLKELTTMEQKFVEAKKGAAPAQPEQKPDAPKQGVVRPRKNPRLND